MEHAKRMTSPRFSASLRLNFGVCVDLANTLEEVVQKYEAYDAESYLHGAEYFFIMKHLYRCTKEVEAFIESCRQDDWVQLP